MTICLVVIYVLAAAAELVGIGLAAFEIRRARKTWTDEINAPATPEEGFAYGLGRAQTGLQELFVGGRKRRLVSVLLLGAGVVLGAVGNLVSLAGH